MHTSHRATLACALAMSSLTALGCSSGSEGSGSPQESGDTASQISALDELSGGLTMTDEKPAFGDPQLEATVAPTTDGADATDFTSDLAGTPARAFHIALFWGHLPPVSGGTLSPSETSALGEIVWNGSVSVDTGAITVSRTLGFEPNDRVYRRTNPRIVAFRTTTAPFVDGLFLRVVIPLSDAMTLHFKTAPLTTDIDLSTLGLKLGGEQRLADGRDGLGFIGYPDDGCAQGLFFGHWRATGDQIGVMNALVLDGEGAKVGHLRGIWGHAPKRDANVFFAKYIDPAGKFEALAAGEYGDGEFAGVWSSLQKTSFGFLGGFSNDGYVGGDGGFWMGRFSTTCGT